jgi:hypothetical protein
MTTRTALFTQPEAQAIWDRFFGRIKAICRKLPDDAQRELILELEDHLYESFRAQPGESEVEKLAIAIENMGDPDEFVRPLVADHQLAAAGRTLDPRSVFLGLLYNTSRGAKAVGASFLYGLGYLLSLGFLLVALGKPFSPDRIGLFVRSGGGLVMGILDQPPAGSTELLGYWIIPVGIVLSVVIYWTLTRLISRGRSTSRAAR